MSQMLEIHPEVMDEIEKERSRQQSQTESLENIEDKPTNTNEGESSRVFGGWKIVTGLGDQENMKKIIDSTLLGYHKEMQESQVIIFGGNERAQYPEVRISGNSFFNTSDAENLESKYFSMILPTHENGKCRYFLRKGVGKGKNDSMLELSELEIDDICRVANKVFFPFLLSLQGVFMHSAKEFNDKLPESVTIRDGKTMKLVFKIDEGDMLFKKGRNTVMPNISVRIWEFGGRDGWFARKPGVTMSCFNFYLLVNAAFKSFIPDVKSLMRSYFLSMKKIKQLYEDVSEENMDDVEPLVQ
jgi:hypothetical protein